MNFSMKLLYTLNKVSHFRKSYSGTQGQANCLSRSEEEIDYFSAQKKTLKRWNLFNQIKIEDGNVVCKHESYNLRMACVSNFFIPTSNKCTLFYTNEIIDLNPQL